METPRTKTYFGYLLVHQDGPDAEPTNTEFGHDDYCQAREAYLMRHERDTTRKRSGHFTTGLFPNSQLFFIQRDDAQQETNRIKILSNRHQPYPFGRVEPMARLFLHQRQHGMEWFVEDADHQRVFFEKEAEALKFTQAAPPGERWKFYNLDRHLDSMEGRSIQFFLMQRSALSTNQLEILSDLGRGTLSKIKNGQRILSRKQYSRIVRVLQHYGYVAWVDLRLLEEEKDAA